MSLTKGRVKKNLSNYPLFVDKRLTPSVVPGSVQVPENRTRGQKSFRTGPGTARISESVLEPEPEPPKALGQFDNLSFLECKLPP